MARARAAERKAVAASGATPAAGRAVIGGAEMGSSGLRHSGGWIQEEFLHDLQGARGMKVYREMRDNAAVVGGCLGMIGMLCRQVPWWVDPAPEREPEDLERAAFVNECIHDMSFSWTDTVGEHLTMLPYGWAFSELVYRRRDQASGSKYRDGRIGWRKIALRAQETLQSWDLDANGGIQGMKQLDLWGGRGSVSIPIEKALLLRTVVEKNNPEGRSILRSAYFPWYFLKGTIETEAIGVTRDLTGVPVFEVPSEIMSPDASPAEKTVRVACDRIVKKLRRGEEDGILIGQSYDQNGHPKFKLSLLTAPGKRVFDIGEIVNRYSGWIAQTMLHDLMFMGQPNTIQYKGTSIPNLFAVALGGWLDVLAEAYNSFAIPRLVELNGWPPERAPRLCHGAVEVPNLGILGDFVNKVVAAGFKSWSGDPAIDEYLRRQGGLPERPVNAQAAPEPTADPENPQDPPSDPEPPPPTEQDRTRRKR